MKVSRYRMIYTINPDQSRLRLAASFALIGLSEFCCRIEDIYPYNSRVWLAAARLEMRVCSLLARLNGNR